MKIQTIVAAASPLLLAAALALQPGCASPEPEVEPAQAAALPGARLWAENCVRCHNLRLPDAYSDAEWSVVMMHMRLRANLTGEEHRAILEFLQAGF
ncbi:MAG: hypothetical protein O7J95_00245, partial [Planctomycetota bacterium]|nr:hypothetical protein [Planctomycetota bacterium]